MTTPRAPYSYVWADSISQIPQKAWDRLAATVEFPFLEWEWFRLLEISNSASPQKGWIPKHLTVWKNDKLVGIAPLFIKSHSVGEFVFDYFWADLSEQLGHPYYPKMVGMSPFTPASGYRFLIDPGQNQTRLNILMLEEIHHMCSQLGLSSLHFNFVAPEWKKLLEKFGFTSWLHQSYMWQNCGYSSFQDFLGIFTSNQRKNIRKERSSLKKNHVHVRSFTGDEIPSSFFSLMYELYVKTCEQYGPWGCKFLSQYFFLALEQTYRDKLMFMAAFHEDDPVKPLGLSMFVHTPSNLFGRYWGARRHVKNLHFELCYYAPIEWAINNSINRFDPGMGGFHKTRRGFAATLNYSLHRFYNPAMRTIFEENIGEVNRLELQEIDSLNKDLPLKQFSPSPSFNKKS